MDSRTFEIVAAFGVSLNNLHRIGADTRVTTFKNDPELRTGHVAIEVNVKTENGTSVRVVISFNAEDDSVDEITSKLNHLVDVARNVILIHGENNG